MKCSHFLVRGPVLALLLTLMAVSFAQAQATLVTDKQNYSPGEVVHVTGSGWMPGETVTLRFYKNDIQTPQTTFDETATEAGTIANDGFIIAETDTNSSFVVEARGGQSGLSAHTGFLDGSYLSSLTVGAPDPSSFLLAGQCAHYKVTVQTAGYYFWGYCNSYCSSAALSVQGLPAGTSAYFWDTTLIFPSGAMPAENCRVASTTLVVCVGTAAQYGYYSFTVVANGCGEQVVGSGVLHIGAINHPPVLDPIADRGVDEGTDLALTVHAMDPDYPAQTLTYSLTRAPSGASINPSTGRITWIPTEMQGPGGESFTVNVADNGTPPMSASTSFYVHVYEVNRPPQLADIPDWTLAECQWAAHGVSASDPDYFRNYLHFWLSPGAPDGLAIDPHDGRLTWTPSEGQGPGTYLVTVNVGDDGYPPLQDSRTCTITVEEVNLPPTITLPPLVTVYEGESAGFQALASDPDLPANPLTFALVDPVPANALIDPSTGVVSWPAVDDGNTLFHVAVADGHGGIEIGDVAVAALNVAPTVQIAGPASGSLISVGTPVKFTGTFTDAGTADTHTAEWTFDAIHVAGAVDEAAHTVQGTVTFTTAGVYAVRLAVTDDDGGVGQASQVNGVDALVVVYDPNAGFATGGGWIQSPPGAYAADPGLSGKANFGFVSKYQRGATAPSGETEFQFKVAGLDFHSISYDWLVVAANRAQFKGLGTINGAGSYGFLLTALDGDLNDGTSPDRFRMKIVDRVTGDAVYDNQVGAADGEDPTTLLGGGAIVIHTNAGSNRLTGAANAASGQAGTLPTAYALYANRPNPFAGSTTIGFALPEPGRVSLVVYDIAGRVVSRLAGEDWPAGWHELPWSGNRDDGGRAAAGVYFYRITVQPVSGGAPFRALHRMVLVK